MEFHQLYERWFLGKAGYEFNCTRIFREHGNRISFATVPQREHEVDLELLGDVVFQNIPAHHIWPLYTKDLTIFSNPDPAPDSVYIKRPRLDAYDSTAMYAELMLQEAHVCQILKQDPHENILRYLGCLVDNGRIVGLAFEKCDLTLRQLVEGQHDSVDSRSYRKAIAAEAIKATIAGLEHLRKQDFVHGDLTVDNLMSKKGIWKIIDFDSCRKRGDPLSIKKGAVANGVETAEFCSDDLGLESIRQFLEVE
ncbi:hypothetical protein VE00_06401 [Pseudogymnoascus sp. WSF 3629]|nr:hypothetical protein VE00_06401 [Pseudogymnoascus sp. WSF 3629]